MGFAGLVSHLYYHEPSNLVFVSFLVKGLFHNLCQPTRKGKLDGCVYNLEIVTETIVKLALQENFFYIENTS